MSAESGSSPCSELAALIAVVQRLRDPVHGCPWDLEQTHTSLIPYVLEEAHEVADAIRNGDDAHLQEELGDLLLQVLLHAQIASEAGRFDLAVVARGLREKLVRRHPHVFAAAGFEWESMAGVWAKVEEELSELREAVASGDRAHAESELGDVIFTLVNVARWCGLDPDEGLAGTNRRFLDRFSRVEVALGGDLSGQSIEQLEGLWQQAKAQIRAAQDS
jgi:XTP/dITP diphosphohydrolase